MSSIHRLSAYAAVALLATGCQSSVPTKTVIRIPNGPNIVLPSEFHAKTEGDNLLFGVGNLATEGCAAKLRVQNITDPIQAVWNDQRPYGITACSPTGCATSWGATEPITKKGGVLRMPLPTGNTDYVLLARPFGAQTVLLEYCPANMAMRGDTLEKILTDGLRP